jgi:hypothetical protein
MANPSEKNNDFLHYKKIQILAESYFKSIEVKVYSPIEEQEIIYLLVDKINYYFENNFDVSTKNSEKFVNLKNEIINHYSNEIKLLSKKTVG